VQGTIACAAAFAMIWSGLGFFLHPFGPEPNYESVSRYLATSGHPDDPIFVWGNIPEIYWASGKRPATRFLTTSFMIGNYPGRPQDEETKDDTTKQAWADFYQDFKKNPPRYLIDTSTSDVRGADKFPISSFPRLATIVAEQYHYDVTIDGYDIYVRNDT